MQSEVLPSELHLVVPPTLPQARSYMFKQQSELQEYDLSKGNRIRVNLPRLQKSYLMKESYLRFRLNIDFTALVNQKLWLDRCGAFGLFDRIEVYDYLGGTLIEQTQNIPALATLLGDLNYNLMDFNGRLQATQGYEGSNVQASATAYDAYEVRTANTGVTLYPGQTVGTESRFITYEFCIPVLSFLGMFSEKYVPLHNGFSIDFFLNSPDLAFVSRIDQNDTANTTVTLENVWISNFEYCCQVMELGDQAEAMVVAQEPLIMHATQFRYFNDIVLGSGVQSSFRFDLNLNVVSLRNIRWSMRPTVYQSLAYPSYGHRIRNYVNNWNFQYGSSYLPEIAGITTRALTVPTSRKAYTIWGGASGSQAGWAKAAGYNQSYLELAKTTSPGKGIAINQTEYMIDLAAQYGTSDFGGALTGTGAKVPVLSNSSQSICGKFAAGLDTRLSHKNTVSGIDTNGLLVSVNATFDRDNVNSMTQAILDLWAEFDTFVQVIPGVASTVTF